MTQGVYMGRKALDPGAVAALEEARGHWEAGVPDQSQEPKKWVLSGFVGFRWVWRPSVKEDRPLQAYDLHLWCAVRDLNPEPADSDYSVVDCCR